jgi:hypothetical protein
MRLFSVFFCTENKGLTLFTGEKGLSLYKENVILKNQQQQ